MAGRATLLKCAELLGGDVQWRVPRSRLVASLDGFPVEVWLVSGEAGTDTHFRVSLPGWPATNSLRLRYLLISKYDWFPSNVKLDDPWVRYFRVWAKDPETVRLQLTPRRLSAIKDWFSEQLYHDGPRPRIANGRI